jgi:hypothetical protein
MVTLFIHLIGEAHTYVSTSGSSSETLAIATLASSPPTHRLCQRNPTSKATPSGQWKTGSRILVRSCGMRPSD